MSREALIGRMSALQRAAYLNPLAGEATSAEPAFTDLGGGASVGLSLNK